MKWTPKLVEERIREAAETAKLLPGVRPAGYRSYWPETLATKAEMWGVRVEGTILLEKHNDEKTRVAATNAAIDNFDMVQDWMGLLDRQEVSLIWHKINGRAIGWIARRLGYHRNTPGPKYRRAIRRLVDELNDRR